MADSKTITTLNLGSQRVGAAVFGRTSGGELVLKKYEFSEMMGDPSVDATRLPQLKVAISELAEGMKIKANSVWYSVPGRSVFTRFVKLPPVSADKLGQIVEFEARQNVPFPINEVSWDYEFTSDEDFGEREVVLVAMKSDALNELNDQLVAANLKTSGVDIAPMAIYNAFRFSYPEVDETSLIIDLGASSTNLIFAEGGKMFTCNILVGGASLTNAISRDFGIGFAEAESQKVTQGFVALGGNVEDHSDPGVAALSKSIRNGMTKLHAEVMRRNNQFRSQQGGGAIQRIFLCGGGAQLGYVAEFFQEKFKVPVETFNALRGVSIAPGVNADAAHQEGHLMGELVGAALRQLGACPVEVELIPDALASARDASKRAPLLVMAGICVCGALLASIVYVKKANEAIREKVQEVQVKHDKLAGHALAIAELNSQIEDLKGQSGQLEEAVNDRSYWVRMMTDLNNKFENDFVWLTTIEPLKDNQSLTPILVESASSQGGSVLATLGGPTALFPQPTAFAPPAAGSAAPAPDAPPADPNAAPARMWIRLLGLYRTSSEGQEVVYKYAKALASSEFFDAPDINDKLNDYCKAEAGVAADRHAYKFEIRLPLKSPMQFKK